MRNHDEIWGANPCLSTITVAIPVYNSARYVRTAIESVLKQSFQNFEIIVVDDGSTDNTIEIVNGFNDKRITIYGQHHYGPAAARNRALELARTEFVAFLDSDDFWYPHHLRYLNELRHRFPSASLLGNSYSETDQTNDVIEYHPVDYLSAFGEGRAPFFTSSCMVRRIVAIAVGGFPTGENYGEDIALWFKLSAYRSCAASNYIGCRYVRRSDSLMGSNSFTKEPHCLEILKNLKHQSAMKCYRRIVRNQFIDCITSWHWLTAFQYARKLASC